MHFIVQDFSHFISKSEFFFLHFHIVLILLSTKNFEEKNTTVIISLKSFNKKCTVNIRGKKTTTSSARNIRFNRSATSNVKGQTPQEAWNERTPSFNHLGT
jgi:hypothetical protein